MSTRLFNISSLLLLAVAVLLRWPYPEFQWRHVDERAFITMPLGFWGGDLNPHFFNYPTLHFYLVSALYFLYYIAFSSETLEQFLAYRYFVDASDLISIARGTTTAFSVGTVAVVMLLGKRIYGATGALAAGFVVAVVPLHVRFSHLATTDSPAAFWVSLSILGAVGIVQEGRRRDYLMAGICAGLAAATKYPGGLVLVAAAAAALLRHPTLKRPGFWITCSSAILVFALATPYVWMDSRGFWADFSAMGAAHLVSTERGRGESTLAYHVRYTLVYGVGLTVMATMTAAAVWHFRLWRKEEAILLIFIASYCALLLMAGSVFTRYALPIIPALAPLLFRPFSQLKRLRNIALFAWTALLLLEPGHASWKLRAQQMGPDTRTDAQQWLYRRLPHGGRITHLSMAGRVRTLSPNSVLDRQRHILRSFEMQRLIQWYAELSHRSGLPPFYVSLPPKAFRHALSKTNGQTGEAVLFSYVHPLIETDSSQTEADSGEPIETRRFRVGEIGDAVYDWVDLYFLPLGGTYALNSSGPEILATSYASAIAEPVPTAGEYFALLGWLLQANEFVDDGDWAAASMEFEKIQRTPFRMNELVSSEYLYNLSLGLGMISLRRNSPEEGLRYLRIATQIHPSKAVAHYHVGEVLRSLGENQRSADNYRMALQWAEDNARLLHNLGVGFMKLGQFGEGIAVLKRAAHLEPGADVYVNLGVAYGHSGMADKQIGAFRRALELNPQHPQSANIRKILESTGNEDSGVK